MSVPAPSPLVLHRSRRHPVEPDHYVDLIVEHFGVALDYRVPPPFVLVVADRTPGKGKIHAAELTRSATGVCGASARPDPRAGSSSVYWSVLAVVPDGGAVTAVSAVRGVGADPCRLCRKCYFREVGALPVEHGRGCEPAVVAPVTVTLSAEAAAVVAAVLTPVTEGSRRPDVAASEAVWQEIRRAFPVDLVRALPVGRRRGVGGYAAR